METTGSCFSTAWGLKTHLPPEYLHMPEETFQGLLLSVGPEAVQHFLALLPCSWYQLLGELARVVGMEQGAQSPCVVVVKPCDSGEI